MNDEGMDEMSVPTARDSNEQHALSEFRPAGLKLPSIEEQAPVWDAPISQDQPHPAVWLLGAHGGAGVSTLARSWAPAADSQRGWPAADRYANVVVVARTHRTGLTAAHALLRQSAGGLTGGCALLGLVIVPDQDGKLPTTLRRQVEVVEGLAPQVWRVPFVPVYRTLTHEQMPVWSPRDAPAEPTKRFARTDAAEVIHPEIAEVGRQIFDAARAAVAR